jgi:hypothetical protein
MSGQAAAGSTAKGGILGRRKRVLPEPPYRVTMWRQAEDGAAEQVRCLLSEARKYVAAATLPERGNGLVKSRKNAGVFEAQSGSRCRYCGAASESAQICPRCEQIRDRHEQQASIQNIAAAMQADPTLSWNQARDSGWIGDDALQRKVQRTLANRERTAAAERLAKHGPGRLERDGPAVKVSEAVAKAKRTARSAARQRSNARGVVFAEAAE